MFNKQKLAIVMLACRDYEAMELALACHTAYGDPDVHFYILQNCRGNYDAERTLDVARRYQKLFPKMVRVVDYIHPQAPYHAIKQLLESDLFGGYDYICKVDDDAFPINDGWLDKLLKCWDVSADKYGEKLAYVTPLINNNNWGFAELINDLGLKDEYFGAVAREHYAGVDTEYSSRRLLSANELGTGVDGTVWGLPYLARWIHEHTTLQPQRFIEAVKGQAYKEVPSQERYSIGCILFKKDFWSKINDGGSDDEHMMHMYCRKNNLVIVCDKSIPFAHIAYFTQREENRDIVEAAKQVYQQRLEIPFPIGLRQSRLLEIEARLRWIENKSNANIDPNASSNSTMQFPVVHGFTKKLKMILYIVGLRSKPPRI